MDTLKYKGFIGSIEAELDDDTLYGKVLGLDKGTLVTYEGKTLAELKEDFINAVEDYIASSVHLQFQYQHPNRTRC